MKLLLVLIPLLSLASFAQDPPSTGGQPPAPPIEDPNDEFGIRALMVVRDPFLRPKFAVLESIKTELQRFETQEFELSAIITGPNQTRAMILDPDGKTHFVKVGDKIGKKDGFIASIGEEDITIRERDVDYFGNRKVIIAKLTISETDILNSNDPKADGEGTGRVRFQEYDESGNTVIDEEPFNNRVSPQSSAPISPNGGQSAAASGASASAPTAPPPMIPPPAAAPSPPPGPVPGQSGWPKYSR